MWVFKWWRKLYNENPKAVAMLWLGTGLGQLIAALFILQQIPTSPTLPALLTFGLLFVSMAWFHWRRAARIS